MRDCLLLVDVFGDFGHEDGDSLLACYRERFGNLHALVDEFRRSGNAIVYANDSAGIFNGDVREIVARARSGPAGRTVDSIAPRPMDRFVVKPRYSAFDSTPLGLILDSIGVDRIFLAGMSTEGCVAQTAIAARERGFKVTVVSSASCTNDLELEEIALAYLERVVGVRIETGLQSAKSQRSGDDNRAAGRRQDA